MCGKWPKRPENSRVSVDGTGRWKWWKQTEVLGNLCGQGLGAGEGRTVHGGPSTPALPRKGGGECRARAASAYQLTGGVRFTSIEVHLRGARHLFGDGEIGHRLGAVPSSTFHQRPGMVS